MTQAAVVFEDRVRIPADVFDLQNFRRWAHSDEFPERGCISFLDGEVDVDMSPEELETHNKCKGDVHGDLRTWNRRHDLGELFPDGAFVVNERANLATEPDITFCSWKSLEEGLVSLREWVEGSERFVEIAGSPDLTVEVVSKTSDRKDTKVLPKLYYSAGVREYWIIDARRDAIQFQILARGKGKFIPVVADSDGYFRSKVMNGSFKLVRERNRRGTYRYTLLCR